MAADPGVHPAPAVPPRVVVAAAVVRHGRLLAARRTRPPEAAGRWELPGGRVEPGEPEAAALVRECAEELRARVRPVARLGDDVAVGSGLLLRAWRCELVDEAAEPAPREVHDAVRWLAAEEVDEVDWLPADRPAVASLTGDLAAGTPLAGGRVGGAVRVGPTVRRPSGPWTPAVHELLDHLHRTGLPGVPRAHGVDRWGREVLGYLPGEAAPLDRPATPQLLADVGRWLAAFHAASVSFPAVPERRWRRGEIGVRDGAVVCHNDLSPVNLILAGGRLVGVVDWDMAAPGHPLDDVAFAAWQLVLRHGLDLDREAAGLTALGAAYGTPPVTVLARVGPRLRGALAFIRRGAAAGDPGLATLLGSGIPEATEAGLAALLARSEPLRRLLMGPQRRGR
jgi:8-oxo-dGTP pyrophosphatase MutT (NUDIX family)